MTINKFQGKTKEEAIKKAKEEFGENVVIMNVKEIKPKGLFRFFKSSTYEVTAAMEERDNTFSLNNKTNISERKENINLAADEEIILPKIQSKSHILPEPIDNKNDKRIEERLENISSMLEEKLSSAIKEKTEQESISENVKKNNKTGEEFKFIRMLYNTLLKNEVDEKYINQVIQMLGLEKKLENLPSQLSGGQQQRVAIARALASKPAIILADEPTGNLDTKTSQDVLSLLKITSERFSQTIVMITHNEEIAQLADRIIRIEDGKILKKEG